MSTYVEIPTSDSNPHYTQSVTLDDTIYQLELRYNSRMQRWILSVRTPAGDPIVLGIPMLAMRNLVGQYTTLAVPPGALFCANLADHYVDPTLASFLIDTGFFYRSAS